MAQGPWHMAHGKGGPAHPWGPGARPQVQGRARRAPGPWGQAVSLAMSHEPWTINNQLIK